MSTIRVSDEVKERLRDLKRDDESFNDLLDRLSRQEVDFREMGKALNETTPDDFGERTEQAHDELNASLEERVGE